jgi:hypothetical protein
MKNLHVFKIQYIPPTLDGGHRIKIKSERFNQSIFIPFINGSTMIESATECLNSKGYDIQFSGEGNGNTMYLISQVFKSLKESK